MSAPVGLAIVGSGGAATLVGAASAEAGGVRLVACCSARRERATAFAAEHGGRAHADLASLLGDDAVEAVYLATPNALHGEQGLRVLGAGRHLLVEKPMTLTVAEAAGLTRAASAAGLVLGVGFHLRHAEPFRDLHRRLRAGDVGEPLVLRAAWGMVLPALQGWKDDPAVAGAGALMGLGVHVLDLARWLLARDAVRVAAVTESSGGRLDRTGVFALGFEGGCVADLVVSRSALVGPNSLWIHGSAGTLVAEEALAVRAEGRLRDGEGRVLAEARRNPYAAELDAFAAAVRGGPAFHADGQDGEAVVRLTDALAAAF